MNINQLKIEYYKLLYLNYCILINVFELLYFSIKNKHTKQ